MKFPIEWHEQCLVNQIASHERLKVALEQAAEAERRSREDIDRYTLQIQAAKERNLESFDRDKLKVK